MGRGVRRMSQYERVRPILADNLRFWCAELPGRGWLRLPRFAPRDIDERLFGLHVAPGPGPHWDDYLLERLDDVGIATVRVDVGMDAAIRSHALRFIDRLVSSGREVVVRLVPMAWEARGMGAASRLRRWSAFVDEVLEELAGRVLAFEVGSAPNRSRWSGYSLLGYASAVETVARLAAPRGCEVWAPCVNDFEPLYSVGLLARLRERGALPAVQTVQLFVDRAGAPENHDDSVLRTRLGGHFDALAKARMIAWIGRRFGIEKTASTYANWTLSPEGRNRARHVTEERYASYMVRYLVLLAAGGHLHRIFWGPLVSAFKGLIDDGTGERPYPPAAHHQFLGRADPGGYRIRPAFRALAMLGRTLQGSRLVSVLSASPPLFLFEFARSDSNVLVGWTTDGSCQPRSIVAGDVTGGRWLDRDGVEAADGALLRGRPFYLVGSREQIAGSEPIHDLLASETSGRDRDIRKSKIENRELLVAFPSSDRRGRELAYRSFDQGGRRGAVAVDLGELGERFCKHPGSLLEVQGAVTVRHSRRGTLAFVPLPGGVSTAVLVRYGTTPWRSLWGRLRRLSRARRVWLAACRLMENDLGTAIPLAFVEDAAEPARRESWLLTERLENVIQARTVFEAMNAPGPLPGGLDRPEFLDRLGEFLRQVHRVGLIHRDLHGGNILVSPQEGRFFIVDLDRSRLGRGKPSRLRRVVDLARIRLSGSDRRRFLRAYDRRAGFAALHALAVLVYRCKLESRRLAQRIGRALRGGQTSGPQIDVPLR